MGAIFSAIEDLRQQIRDGQQQLRDTRVVAGVVLVPVCLLWPLIVALLDWLQYLAVRSAIAIAIALFALRVLAPECFGRLVLRVQGMPEFVSLAQRLERLIGEAADIVVNVGPLSVDTRVAIQWLNGYSWAVVGATGQGKSKMLNFMHEPLQDGTPVVHSRPTANTDSSGVTKEVYKIPTFLKDFYPLSLKPVKVDVWDVPGLFDDITWRDKLTTANRLREDMVEALKHKVDQTKWAFILVIKVGGERLDRDSNTESIMNEFNSQIDLHLDAVYRATCVILTGLDDLIWPGQDEMYAKDKFNFRVPGQLELATQSWLSHALPEGFRKLVRRCGDRALLWSNRPDRMYPARGDQDSFSRLQMEAFVKMLATNRHGQDYQNVIPQGGCFPAAAKVRLEGCAKAVPISKLRVGDRVQTSGGYSPCYLISHNAHDAVAEMVTLTTDDGHRVTATPQHYVPLRGGGFVEIGGMVLGDTLLVQRAGGGSTWATVTEISRSMHRGLYNPITLTGDIVVDGVLISCW